MILPRPMVLAQLPEIVRMGEPARWTVHPCTFITTEPVFDYMGKCANIYILTCIMYVCMYVCMYV